MWGEVGEMVGPGLAVRASGRGGPSGPGHRGAQEGLSTHNRRAGGKQAAALTALVRSRGVEGTAGCLTRRGQKDQREGVAAQRRLLCTLLLLLLLPLQVPPCLGQLARERARQRRQAGQATWQLARTLALQRRHLRMLVHSHDGGGSDLGQGVGVALPQLGKGCAAGRERPQGRTAVRQRYGAVGQPAGRRAVLWQRPSRRRCVVVMGTIETGRRALAAAAAGRSTHWGEPRHRLAHTASKHPAAAGQTGRPNGLKGVEQQEQHLRRGWPAVCNGEVPAWSKQAPRAAGGRSSSPDRTCEFMIGCKRGKAAKRLKREGTSREGLAGTPACRALLPPAAFRVCLRSSTPTRGRWEQCERSGKK